MASTNEILNLYSAIGRTSGVSDSEIEYWQNSGLSSDALRQQFLGEAAAYSGGGYDDAVQKAKDIVAQYTPTQASQPTTPSVGEWFNANKGASSSDLAKAVNQYGFSTEDVAKRMGIPANLVGEMLNNYNAFNNKQNTTPTSSSSVVAANNTPSSAATATQSGVPQQPQPPQYTRQPWMNNPIPPQYQQMTRQQMQPPSWYSQTPPWVQQMQSWGRQQPQQQPPMPPQYQQPQMCQAPQQLRYAQPTYGRY
jgi:hypothetical protein